MNNKLCTDDVKLFLHLLENLNNISDIDLLLDKILFESRLMTNADAGSIYLIENNELVFRYVQNDTISKKMKNSNIFLYKDLVIPINNKSIAGYCALHSEPLFIDDVYNLENVPYSFNNSFDTNTGYRTKSILTIPLNTLKGKTIAVIQIINKKDESGNIQSFTETDELYVSFFASNASSAIERSRITREMVLRMVKMAELRDPKETGAHVNRVGAYCIEIYEKWARGKGLAEHEIKSNKDIFRIAAMLHDVGKVAIPDAILKKPGKLDESEYEIMKTHCYQGSLLFPDEYSQLDAISKEVAYTHHEKWNGTGYPRGLSNDSISIFGRITSLADVYDALISKRVYKEAWDEKDVLKLIKDSSGKDFDPDVVEAFLSIYDIIAAIRNKYPDTGA